MADSSKISDNSNSNKNRSDKRRNMPSSDEVQNLLENDDLEIDMLKQFTIPKRKTESKDLLTKVEITSHEGQELTRILQQSFKERESSQDFVYSKPRIVYNSKLLNRFTERKKQMRHNGYSEKEVQEIFTFLLVKDESEAHKICKEGIQVGNSKNTNLGDPSMGIYLSKYSDIISTEALKNKSNGTILIFKLIKGRIKFTHENRTGEPLEPAPNYDCHILKTSNIDLSAASLQYLFECTQFYVYEYMEDSDINKKPTQILPFAVINFRYHNLSGRDNRIGPPLLKQQMSLSSISSKKSKQVSNPIVDNSILESSPPFKKLKPVNDNERELNGTQTQLPNNNNSIGNASSFISVVNKINNDSLTASPLVNNNNPAVNKIQKTIVTPQNTDLSFWSGSLNAGNVPLGHVQLYSLYHLLDGSFFDTSVYIYEKMSFTSLKESFFNGLDKINECGITFFQDYYVICGYIVQNINSDARFEEFVKHLGNLNMAGHIKLANLTDVFFIPESQFSKDMGLSNRCDKTSMLHCIFISKKSLDKSCKKFLFSRFPHPEPVVEPFVEKSEPLKMAVTECNIFTEAPSSPDVESQTNINLNQVRDPRLLRMMVKQTKPQLSIVSIASSVSNQVVDIKTVNNKQEVKKTLGIISASRLVSIFENMSDIQDRCNIEIARRNRNQASLVNQSNIIPLLPPNLLEKSSESSKVIPLIPNLKSFTSGRNNRQQLRPSRPIHDYRLPLNYVQTQYSNEFANNRMFADPRGISFNNTPYGYYGGHNFNNNVGHINNNFNYNIPQTYLPRMEVPSLYHNNSYIPQLNIAQNKEELPANRSSTYNVPPPMNDFILSTNTSREISKQELNSNLDINFSEISKIALPDSVVSNAISDPRVRKLLEDLKSKNIIGTDLIANKSNLQLNMSENINKSNESINKLNTNITDTQLDKINITSKEAVISIEANKSKTVSDPRLNKISRGNNSQDLQILNSKLPSLDIDKYSSKTSDMDKYITSIYVSSDNSLNIKNKNDYLNGKELSNSNVEGIISKEANINPHLAKTTDNKEEFNSENNISSLLSDPLTFLKSLNKNISLTK